MLLPLVVVTRILVNPLSNVFQKLLTQRHADPLFIICLTHAWLSLLCLPLIFFHRPPPATDFWLNITIVGVLTVAGNALLVQAVKTSDLSLLGPVNAYKSVVSLLPGMLLLREFPHPLGLAGIALIVAGSYFLVDKKVTEPRENALVRFFRDRGVQYRLAALVISATEAVFLKKALLASSPLITFTFWALLGFAFAAPLVITITKREQITEQLTIARHSAPMSLPLVLTTGLMQLCTILAFAGFHVGYALALFQTSALISVLLGHKIFNEPNLLERLMGSSIMIAGAILIIMAR